MSVPAISGGGFVAARTSQIGCPRTRADPTLAARAPQRRGAS